MVRIVSDSLVGYGFKDYGGKQMTKTPEFNFGKGYSYRPTIGIFKDNQLVIDEKTLIAITYWQDFVEGFREGQPKQG